MAALPGLGALLLAENSAQVVPAPGSLHVTAPGQLSVLLLGARSTVGAALLLAGVLVRTVRPHSAALLPALVLGVTRVPGVAGQLAHMATLQPGRAGLGAATLGEGHPDSLAIGHLL